MDNDAIENWIERAIKNEARDNSSPAGLKVIKRSAQTRGNLIMEIAEKLRPWLSKMFEGVRDENEMLVQPSRVRGIALNVAQQIVLEHEKKSASA